MHPPRPTQKPSDAVVTPHQADAEQAPPRGEIFDGFPSMNDPSPFDTMKNKPLTKLFVGISLVFCLLATGSFIGSRSRKPPAIGPFTSNEGAKPALKVQVAGQVVNPGVYDLPAGSRLQDAIQMAGGALPNADLSNLKLADWATDGSKIEVPMRTGTPVIAPTPLPASPTASPNNFVSPPPIGTPPTASTPTASTAPTPVGGNVADVYLEYLKKNPVNLNSATVAQLDVLPDVGPKMAERIVAYREANGGFKSVDELNNVKGIGEKRLENLRGLVTIQ